MQSLDGSADSVHQQKAHRLPDYRPWANWVTGPWACYFHWVSFPSTHTHASDVYGAVCFTPRLSFPDSLTSLCLPSSKKLIPQSPSFMAPESEMVTVKIHHLERTKMTPTRVFPSLLGKASSRQTNLGANGVPSYGILWMHSSDKGHSLLPTEDKNWEEWRNEDDQESQPDSYERFTL